MAPFSNLNTAWFALIGVLWAGFLFLEGFDFGVAVVTPFLVRDEHRPPTVHELGGTDVGRQRSVAAGGRGRDLRGIPDLVRRGCSAASTWRCSSYSWL